MRIGVFGGSFDPPHLGHVAVANAAQQHANLDVILFVPAGQQWQKQHFASSDLRSHMVSLIIRQHTDWLLSSVDIDRQTPTYTIDTLHDIAQQFKDAELFFIVGHDAATKLESWHRSQELAALCSFLVIARPGHDDQLPQGFKIEVISAITPDVSSSGIRALVSTLPDEEKLGALAPLVGDDVAKFITSTGLYS
ncbi:MAG: hypothetical protein RLZZ426_959 [Actinomycetota bacterium]|jgi:nicotinate-nucleotide adenylyltransferase